MKEGYIVWNLSNCDCEFFGVYKTFEKAEKQFRKVIRAKYGRCPRMSYDELLGWLIDNNIEGGDDSLRITQFNENVGE